VDEVTSAANIQQPVTLVDVTLREGQQAAEVAFDASQEVEYALALQRAGITTVQVGYAGGDDPSISRIREACPELKVMALLVGWKDDASAALKSARSAGADICSILFRSADAHLEAIGYTREAARQRVVELVHLARAEGYTKVVYGPSFSSQADLDYLLSMYRAASAAGADVVSFSDSLGVMMPASTAWIVKRIKAVIGDADVRLHMHNDYGLALANTLAGLEAGAGWAEVSCLGLGERAGNCALEELVLALEGLYGIDTGVETTQLVGLCSLVAHATGVAIPPMKPVAGQDTFANKLEIHLQAVAQNATLMEPYDPALIGNERTIKLGKGTGPTGVRIKAAELGLRVDDDRLDHIVAAVNESALARRRALSDEEFRELVLSR
jgi:isopropylmalate/homocitrate/citramalate synthase